VSQENADVAQRFTDAYKHGDWVEMAATLDPYVFVRTDPIWPEPFMFGRDAVVAWFRGIWESAGRDFRIEEVVDLGDRVLLRQSWTVRGQQSGVTGQQPVSDIVTVRDGLIIFIEYFLDHERALKAVELEE
jgi:ketosteroid isomerase-like protein